MQTKTQIFPLVGLARDGNRSVEERHCVSGCSKSAQRYVFCRHAKKFLIIPTDVTSRVFAQRSKIVLVSIRQENEPAIVDRTIVLNEEVSLRDAFTKRRKKSGVGARAK